MQIPGPRGIQTLSHARELQSRRDDHDRQQREGEFVQQAREAFTEQDAQ